MEYLRLSLRHSLLLLLCCTFYSSLSGQIQAIPAEVNFSNCLQEWDGFGFNYVEACQTRNYENAPQDYGGFSLLSEQQRKEILELVFGEEGLQVEIVKMFLDPFHQTQPGGPFNHEWTTKNMLFFVENGLDICRRNGRDLTVLTTLYGPPAWATQQRFLGGRDLDTTQFDHLAAYMIDWARFLRQRNIPVRYLSIHNEGEDFYRWTFDEGKQRMVRFDYNAYWPPRQINDFIKVLHGAIQETDFPDLHVTNGEPSNWTRFYQWGYAWQLYEDEDVLNALGLLTTHGFYNGDYRKLSYSQTNGATTNLLRQKRPELHAWITSFSWGDMDATLTRQVHEHIYTAGVNAVIPWAGIQHPESWIEGDPNPGTAIIIRSNGRYEISQGYYFYKQLTSAGHRGMAVANTYIANSQANLIAFAGNDTGHPDAFVVTDYIGIWGLPFAIRVKGTDHKRFRACRTMEDGTEKYKDIGVFELKNGVLNYDPPKGSVTTFIGLN